MSTVNVDEILEHQLNANMLLMPYEVYGQLFDSVAELGEENAKLRELVRDMTEEMRGLGVDFKRVGWCDYADRMRELGVEV